MPTVTHYAAVAMPSDTQTSCTQLPLVATALVSALVSMVGYMAWESTSTLTSAYTIAGHAQRSVPLSSTRPNGLPRVTPGVCICLCVRFPVISPPPDETNPANCTQVPEYTKQACAQIEPTSLKYTSRSGLGLPKRSVQGPYQHKREKSPTVSI